MGPSGLCDTDVATFYSLILFSWLSLRSFENSITLERSVSLAVSGGGLILPLCAIANIVTWCQHVAQVFLSIILCVYCNTASEYDLIQQNSRSMSPAYAFASCIYVYANSCYNESFSSFFCLHSQTALANCKRFDVRVCCEMHIEIVPLKEWSVITLL